MPEEIFAEMMRDLALRKAVDYSRPESIRQYNQAFDRIAQNIRFLDQNHPEWIPRLVELAQQGDAHTAATCAPLLLKLHNISPGQRDAVLGTIRQLLEDSQVGDTDRMRLGIILTEHGKSSRANPPL